MIKTIFNSFTKLGVVSICLLSTILLTSCAYFNSPTPGTNVAVKRSGIDGKGNIKVTDTFEMPERWGNGMVMVEMSEEFQTVLDENGYTSPEEVLSSRTLRIFRVSDASISAAVATGQQEATGDAVASVSTAAITGGALYLTGGGSGAGSALSTLLDAGLKMIGAIDAKTPAPTSNETAQTTTGGTEDSSKTETSY